MTNVTKQTKEQLIFNRDDCAAAISANPMSENTQRYLVEMNECREELSKRFMRRRTNCVITGVVLDSSLAVKINDIA